MRWFLGGVALILALILAGASFVVYRIVWGTPFRFNDLLNRQAIFTALENPQTLTQYGIIDGAWYDFTSGKLDAYSPAERENRFARTRKFDAEIAAWDKKNLSPQERLSYDIVRWGYSRNLADEKYPWLGANNSLYPVNQAFGIQMGLPNFLLSTHQIANARLARHYVQRLKALGTVLDAVRADVARQAEAGVIAPDFVIDRSIDEMKALIAPIPGENPLITHLAEKTAAIGMDADERDALVNTAIATMLNTVYPAYRRLIAEEQRLRASAGHDAGVWRLKGGDVYYADQLKTLTSTDLTPDEIYTYGLSEVTRITAEMDGVLKSIGLTNGTVGERMDALMADPRFLLSRRRRGTRASADALRAGSRPRADAAAEVLCTYSQDRFGGTPRTRVLRKRRARRLLRTAVAQWHAAGNFFRQFTKRGGNADVGDADLGLSRGHPGPSHADRHGNGD